MTDVMEPAAPPRTRRLTRRGIDARDRIVRAMITCIVRAGFEATTVEHVMAEAGLSRGSLLHQFPTRLELTVAAAEYAMRTVIADADRRVRAIGTALERLVQYPTVMWDAQISDCGLALTDILLAARWDTHLADALLPVTGKIELQVSAELLELAQGAGLPDPAAYVPHGWLLLASTRGLIIEYKLDPSRPIILQAMQALQDEHRLLCQRLLAQK